MKLNKPARIVELAPERQEERVVFNASPRAEEPASVESEVIPPLVQTRGEVIPPLQPVQRVMKRVELAPVQPVAETDVTAESADADTDLTEEEQEFIEYELESEQTGHLPPLVRVSKRQVVQLDGDSTPGDRNVAEQYAEDIIRDESARAEADKDFQEIVGEEQRIPPLEPVVRNEAAIPALVKTRDGSEIVGEIPQLTAYNKMEVVYLLIGKSVEDEEVVLLQSFSERFVRTKKQEEFNASLYARVSAHISSMVSSRTYDFEERSRNRTVQIVPTVPHQQARGIVWTAGYLDSGAPTSQEIEIFIDENDAGDWANEDLVGGLKAEGFFRDEDYVFTWALVKVKIGHDFGSFKLSELMPTL